MTHSPQVKGFFDHRTNTISYLVWDPATLKAAVIDSVLDYDQASGSTFTESADALIEEAKSLALSIEWILETHMHADHLSAAPYIQERLGGKIAIGNNITTVQEVFGEVFNAGTDFEKDGSQFDILFKEGDTFLIGNIEACVIETPGHTPACVSYVIGDAVFVGDTLFMPDYGSARCDFPGGSADVLYQSVQKIFALPDTTRMFLCHDYLPEGRSTFAWETTVGEQKQNNLHLKQTIKQEEFVSLRNTKDATLAMPKIIIPSLQVNMRAGHLPPAEKNGTQYLKIPLNSVFSKKTSSDSAR